MAIFTASFCISSFISALLMTTFLLLEEEVDNEDAGVFRSSAVYGGLAGKVPVAGDLFPSSLISAKFWLVSG